MSLKHTLLCMLGSLLVAGAVHAQEAAPAPQLEQPANNEWRPSVNFSVDYSSRYWCRGKLFNPERVMYGDLSLSLKGFYAGVWTAVDLTEENGYRNEPEEWDFYFGYSYTFENIEVINSLELDLNYTSFRYPRYGSNFGGHSPHEQCIALKATTGYAIGDFDLNPGVDVRVDWNHDKWIKEAQWYFRVFVSHDEPLKFLSEKLTFGNTVSQWWGNNHYNGLYFDENGGDDDEGRWRQVGNGLSFLTWETNLTYAINDHVSFGPWGCIGWAIDHNLRKQQKQTKHLNSVNCAWGVKLAFSF